MSAGVSPVPDEAVEAAWAGFKRVPAEDFRGDEDAGMRAALAAAIPALREGIAAEVLGPVRALARRWTCNCGGPSPEGHHEMHCDSYYGADLRAALVQAAEEVGGE